MKRSRLVFDRFKKFNLKVKPSKCEFGMTELKFLGYKISSEGIGLDEKKIEAIVKMPEPKDVKQLQSFLGSVYFNGNHMEHCSTIARPLYALTNKNVKYIWTPEHQKVSEELKQALIKAPLMFWLIFVMIFQ